jgi:hypothetical protein
MKKEVIGKLQKQIKKEGFIEYDRLSAYMCLWSGAMIITDSIKLEEKLTNDDIKAVSNGQDYGLAYIHHKMFNGTSVAALRDLSFGEAALEIQSKVKVPWYKRIFK